MPLKFRKTWVADESFESAGLFDVNNDGIVDIVSGSFWYEGPDFKKKHYIGSVQAVGEYYDDFSTIAMDVNGDGRSDFVTGGWWGGNLRWRENPADLTQPWPEHIIAETSNIETTRAWDIDGDGMAEIVPNTPGGPLVIYKLMTDAHGKGMGKFTSHPVFDGPQGHGLGCGDIAGNGRMDLVLVGGWLECPVKPFEEPWIWHAEFNLPFHAASVPMLVVDVNSDGVNEIIVGNGHGYGLIWLEQKKSSDGSRSWVTHPIDPFCAQYHDMMWVDIDGDGDPELVTGKRHRAHCGNEDGEWDDLGVYYFKWTGQGFAKQVIDYGPIGTGKGCGIHFAMADLRGTGRLDLVAPGKEGLYVFYNEGL